MAISPTDATRKFENKPEFSQYNRLVARFTKAFPDVGYVEIVRAPGRVNVIGEHTDYNGLPVMPMALDREIAIAISPTDDSRVELVNILDSYPRVEFDLSADIPPYDTGHWGNYVKAAAQAIWEWAAQNASSALPLRGFVGCAGGTIPAGSGLSSSSALVVAAALALVSVNDLPISSHELADLLAEGERYVGTQGGGMDQAASILSEAGAALKIDFSPLRTRSVMLPENCLLVVANSMVKAEKTGGARVAYNTRVAECRLGLAMLKHDSAGRADDAVMLRDIFDRLPDWPELIAGLPDGPMSVADVAARVGEDEKELARTCLRQRDGSLLPSAAAGFYPKERCRHVLTEARRVERAAQAAESGDAVALGALMNESHISCARDYEVSCTELDHLVDCLRSAGSLGARLTGAGFGGCTVALVEREKVERLLAEVWERYYVDYLPTSGIPTPECRDEVLFACKAAQGAGLVNI